MAPQFDRDDLVFVGATFLEDREGRALLRLPNGSKTSVSYDALRRVAGQVHFVGPGCGEETAYCNLCDWSERAPTRVDAEDAWIAHHEEIHGDEDAQTTTDE